MRDEDPTLEQLFDAARELERLPNPKRVRLHGSVAARLAGAGALSATATVAVKAAAGTGPLASGALAAVKGKLVWLLALATVGTAGTVFVATRHGVKQPSISRTHVAVREPRALPVAPLPEPRPQTNSPTDTPPEVSSSEPVQLRPVASVRGESGSLANEIAIVRAAQSALAAGQATRVLTLLDTYFHRFPTGVLLPEAKATRIKALCLLGQREQANRQAERFAAAHPDSPLAANNKLRCAP